MEREILINTSYDEVRVAVLEDGRLSEFLWERRGSQSYVGNIYKGIVENVLPGISSAFVNVGFEKNAYLYISDVLSENRRSSIDQILKKGQQIMIQVAKESIGTKGMKVSMDISLPGRYLVMTPHHHQVGVSKQILDAKERRRLQVTVENLLKELGQPRGCVVRTEAEGASDEELSLEVKYLNRMWESIQKKYETNPAPCLLHKDLDLTLQVARDMLNANVSICLVDSKEKQQSLVEFVAKIAPELVKCIKFYDAKTPIFTAYHVEPEIEKLRQSKLSLPSGGSIVIQEAESLCAIDVNTGKFTGSKSQEETVTQTNVEAAKEVARQLRLRNIGGIVVIDFIDMRKAFNRQRIVEVLHEAVRTDRAKIKILPITRLGLVEMTRERKKESTANLLTHECEHCMGSGRVLSVDSMRIKIQREIYQMTRGRPGGNVRLMLHPTLATKLKAKQPQVERNVHRAIKIHPDPQVNWEDYKIVLE